MIEYDKLCEAVNFVKQHFTMSPKIGIICGSGLQDLVELLDKQIRISYSDIPHLPKSTAVGHPGELVFGETTNQVPVVCMRGRVHLYEGYTVIECVRPIRLLAMLGVKVLFLTNASGGLNASFKTGNFMLIKDHISFPNLSGENPLRGSHDPRLGELFVSMSNAYDAKLIEIAEKVGTELGLVSSICKGIYAMVSGPNYETTAEARALKVLGADAVGMSTAHEVIAARQMGVRCLGISLISCQTEMSYDAKPETIEHEQVVEVGVKRTNDLARMIEAMIGCIKD